MKVLFYNHTGQVSGAERLLLMILSRIDRDAFESLVICPDDASLPKLVGELGIPVEAVDKLDARFTWRLNLFAHYCVSFLKVIRQLRQRVVTFEPDLLHANSIRAGLVATLATIGLRPRVVWHLHDMLPRHPFSTLIRLFASASRRTAMIAVSHAVAANFRGHCSRLMGNRVKVILNGIDLSKFPSDQNAKRKIRKELRFRENDLVLGIVGQLTPRKGQLELLRAFARALADFPNMVLLITGAPLFNRDHEYLKELKQTAADLGIANKVRWLGPRNDIDTIMQAQDVLIVNSSVEPFGLVILEAMACGTPVIAASVDGIPEIIRHNQNGWLVPAQDEGELVEAIIDLARREDLRVRLAYRAKKDVAARFSVERYLGQLQKFYDSRTNGRRARARRTTGRQAEAVRLGVYQ